jgi:flagellar assembly protein FliH
MTSAPRKFDFDTVFGGDGHVVSSAPRPKRLYTAEEVEQLRAQAVAEGQQAALASMAALQAQALAQIADACRQAMPALAGVAHAHREGSAALAQSCARAIADAALDRFPTEPLRAALVALAREVEAAPRLMVTVAPELADAMQAALSETAQAVGYPGAIKVRPQAGLPRGAFSLDFGDGAAAYDPQTAATRVAQALEAALAAEGLHAEPLVPGTDPGLVQE